MSSDPADLTNTILAATPRAPRHTVTESGGDIQINCDRCGPFFEMPEPVDFDLMVRAVYEHECDEVPDDD